MSKKPIRTKSIDMTPTDIRIAMIRAGVTQAEIARDVEVSRNTVHLVIEGRTVSDRIRKRIAERIGMDVGLIWPSTYRFGGPWKRGRPVSGSRQRAA